MENIMHNLSWTQRVKEQQSSNSAKFTSVEPEPNPMQDPAVFVPDFLYIAKTPKKATYGVFSKKHIEIGKLIEVAYAFPLYWRQKYQNEPALFQYAQWGFSCPCQKCKEDGPQGFIGTGFSSIYNCPDVSDEANASLYVNSANKTLIISSIKTIQPDEEVLIWYGQPYYDKWCKYTKS